MSGGIVQGAIILGGNSLWAIIREAIVLGRNCPRAIAGGAVVLGGTCLEAIVQRGIVLEPISEYLSIIIENLSKIFLFKNIVFVFFCDLVQGGFLKTSKAHKEECYFY